MFGLKGRNYRVTAAVASLAVVAPFALWGGAATGAPADSDGFEIEVLSGRADTVTGGDALVAVDVPPVVPANEVRVNVGRTDVTSSFAPDPSGRLVGLVDGMSIGANQLIVSSNRQGPGQPGAESSIIINHSINGPVFSGPHQQPFICQTEAAGLGAPLDEDCNAATVVEYLYRSTSGSFEALPDGALPDDLATTTTSDGSDVNYIVRVERGTINRAVYEIAMLHDPSEPLPDPWMEGPAWNGRLVYTYGGGCDAGFRQGSRSGGVVNDGLLSRGYAVASSSQNVFGNNCNDQISAETTMMVKEHFIEQFGVPAHTIGYGCSGGSMQVELIAQNYPGLLDGIVAMCAYPDLQTILAPVSDCALLYRAFDEGSTEYTVEQLTAITGYANNGSISTCTLWNGFFSTGWIQPTPCPSVIPADLWYDPTTNPNGTRCTFWDNNVNAIGVDPDTGYARRPLDNEGVQYGLKALNDGVISFDQFIEINSLAGGFGSDGELTTERTVSDLDAISAVHATGKVNVGAGGLVDIPILDVRGYADPRVDIHDRVRSLSIRERLAEANGNADNHIIWTVPPSNGITGGQFSIEAVYLVDEWLTSVSEDPSDETPAAKLAANKPADAVDSCWTETGDRVVEEATIDDAAMCNQLYPVHLDPRLVSGAPLSNDVAKCALKTIDPADYLIGPTADELAQLASTFPSGTCDYAEPGQGVVPFDGPWQSYGADSSVTGNQVAFITSDVGNLPQPDGVLVDALDGLGLDVLLVDDDDIEGDPAFDYADIGIISSSVKPAKIPAELASLDLPMMNLEGFVSDDLGLATRSGEQATGNNFVVMNPDTAGHPLAAGLQGFQGVYRTDQPTMNFGVVGSDAIVIATNGGAPRQPSYYAYEAGTMLADGSMAPARRVAHFPTYTGPLALTQTGVDLFATSVTWLFEEPPPS